MRPRPARRRAVALAGADECGLLPALPPIPLLGLYLVTSERCSPARLQVWYAWTSKGVSRKAVVRLAGASTL